MNDALRIRMRQQIERELMERAAARRQIPVISPLEQATEDGLTTDILRMTATALRMDPNALDASARLASYGIDSIAITEVMGQIARFLDVPIAPTVFFEAGTLNELVAILRARHNGTIVARYTAQAAPTRAPSADVAGWITRHHARKRAATRPATNHALPPDIAIIAMDGSFADSPDLDALEAHLRSGDDCVTEVPPERWNWQTVDGDPKHGPFTRVRFGGFLPDHDAFDAAFFGISPKEAELMDPQHRLFMQCVWRAIERGGHAPRSLAGRKVGLFLGINLQDYADLANKAGAIDPMQLTGLGHAFCANRLSFLLDLQGPSQVVDTACSSSLVALHRAILSIRHEGCEMAIAGGANLMLTPTQHILFSRVGMLAPDGRCKTFGQDADGYGRADGVAAVMLKRLDLAEQDGNPILAVIRGSAENHGGNGSSLTAPNPAAQARLLIDAYHQAGIDPRSVGMIECHGTGTKLGDPVEIEGLKTAFAALFAEYGLSPPTKAYCGIGSIKSNIGHAETAAGIAGVIKILLAMRHRRRYRSLNCTPANPLIDLTTSPFFLLDTEHDWPSPVFDGVTLPRRAGVSSFGAGGANAHLVLEEYRARPVRRVAPSSQVIPLSARDEAALQRVVAALSDHLERTPDLDLADLAFTLQVGRDALRTRLTFVVDSVLGLRQALSAVLTGQHNGIYTARKDVPAIAPDAPLATIAASWSQGGTVDWQRLHTAPRQRLELPPYPFARTRFWLPQAAPTLEPVGIDRWRVRLDPTSFYLRDHVVGDTSILPGVVALELLCAAARHAGLPSILRQVVWLAPIEVRTPRVIEIVLHRDGTRPRITLDGMENDAPHCYVRARIDPQPSELVNTAIDLAALETAMHNQLSVDALYQRCKAIDLNYGPAHRAVAKLAYGPDTVLARLHLPDHVPLEGFMLHPSMADGAFQAVLGLAAGANDEAGQPFALERMELLGPCARDMAVHIRSRADTGRQRSIDLDLYDADGVLCARLRGLETRGRAPSDTMPPLLYVPEWHKIPSSIISRGVSRHSVLFCAVPHAKAVGVLRPDWKCQISDAATDEFATHAEAARLFLQDAMQQDVIVQVVVPDTPQAAPLTGLAGMVRTARLELPRLRAQVVAVPDGISPDQLAVLLDEAGNVAHLPELRRDDEGFVARFWRNAPSPAAPCPWHDGTVSLITGGLGAIGRLLAEDIVRRSRDAVIVLASRRRIDTQAASWLARLDGTNGAQVLHRTLDIADGSATAALITDIRQRHERLDVVLHAAGLARDGAFAQKTAASLAEVLAPKVAGTLALDHAIGAGPLSLFVLFSSLAGMVGNAGQADYAAANAFLDGFAIQREAMRGRGLRQGHTIAIDWPLWQAGGIRMKPEAERMMTAANGLVPLPTQIAMSALDQAIASGNSHVLVAVGDRTRVERLLNPPPAATTTDATPRRSDHAGIRRATLSVLETIVCSLLKVAAADLSPDIEFNEYGFDSISFTQFADALNQRFDLSLTPTVFFEYITLARLADHLAQLPALMATFASSIQTSDAVTPPATVVLPADRVFQTNIPMPGRHEPDAIAIIGLSGMFPGAPNPEALWQVLQDGRDCITMMPEWRRGSGTPLFGGFIDNIDQFDAAFFGLSAAEARMMDPQQRLLLTLTWRLFEDANIAPRDLSGTAVGVFIGIADSGYGRLIAAAGGAVEAQAMTGLAPSVAANRISFHFNYTGPSVAIETACSSALVAIHRAVAAIRAGECTAAIAGGINTLLLPDPFEGFAKAGMLAPDGRSKSFGDGANGYGRGEGAGLLLLKPLRDAERDGDTILAVIRASAENHGGRANSLTAPNPTAQAELLRRAYRQAGFDPRSVSYIEAHGTGTPLGDPIETEALRSAFAKLIQEAEARFGPAPPMRCGLGSVKSNIGHLELAAGIAGVTKILLQLRHATLAKSLHCATPNKLLALRDSPFHLVQQAQPWEPARDAAGQVLPRRAGVSSFGFGGSNAHIVLEEYPASSVATPASDVPSLIVLSARTEAQLHEWVAVLRDALPALPNEVTAADIAYTLQTCRDGMEHRLAFLCNGRNDLVARLTAISAGRMEDVRQGQVRPNRESLALLDTDEAVRAALAGLPSRGRHDLLLDLWVRGFAFDWRSLYSNLHPRRVRLPGLPLTDTRYWVRSEQADSPAPIQAVTTPPSLPPAMSLEAAGFETYLTELTAIASHLLDAPVADLDADSTLGEFGFDSIGLTNFANQVNSTLGLSLTPADLFEFSTLGLLARHLAGKVTLPSSRAAVEPASVTPSDDPIAIVGMSCCFPGASDAEEFWRNLRDGVDAISEIPADRWDWRAIDGDPKREPNRTNIRWGGFIDNVFGFDPLFFGISWREARLMDPQQRLMLMHAWKAIEDAGHSPRSLAGDSVGVFVGTATASFSRDTPDDHNGGGYVATGTVASIGPNRVSFFLDLHGPSEPIETACSSSLVAVHRATQAIIAGDCEMALAGGVNTMVTPEGHLNFSKAGMLSPDGRCHTFSADANGYVRGEGVGMLFLKRLSAARRDGDPIYAVIRGSAINHGGRANSLTAPNTEAQATLLRQAYTRAGVDVTTVSYIEAHGTGTALGDPVEVNALVSAFGTLHPTKPTSPWCGIGSVKANIGHLELAAGVAGLVKVLLQMRHRTLVSSLHSNPPNPHISLDGTPFYVVRASQPWAAARDAKGSALPRRAGVSSFGFGGVNAHIVLEEVPAATGTPSQGPALVVLSAQEPARLQDQARHLLAALESGAYGDADLHDLAYTLQVGRTSLRERAAVFVGSMDELRTRLRGFLNGDLMQMRCGRAASPPHPERPLDDNPGALAEHWVQGSAIDWAALHTTPRRRLRLPTYPFGLEPLRTDPRETEAPGAVKKAHWLDPSDRMLRDHRVQDACILAGAMTLELARQSIAGDTFPASLQRVVWLKPVIVSHGMDVCIEVNDRTFRIAIHDETHVQGVAGVPETDVTTTLDIDAITARCSQTRPVPALYETFATLGLNYGPSYRSVVALRTGSGEVLAELRLPAGTGSFGMHPSMLDGAFQSCLGLTADTASGTAVPFSLDRLDILRPTTAQMWAHVRERPHAGTVRRIDIDLADRTGTICVRVRGLAVRLLPADHTKPPGNPDLRQAATTYLTALLADATQVPLQSIEATAPLEAYGIDSVLITRLTERLEDDFGPLSRTLFFEHTTLDALAAYFCASHAARLAIVVAAAPIVTPPPAETNATPSFTPSPVISAHDPIAIIGLSGRYPGAPTLDAFWDNLAEGRDSISEVPRDRWDHSKWFDPIRKPGKTYSKWGGFLEDIDRFDALFFNIAPREADFMDPQERLFLQCAWETIEDAGYTRTTLANSTAGVFVGVMYSEYQLYAAERTAAGEPTVLGASAATIANRVSYVCGLNGPSLAVDSMCSSSLTAIHLACESLRAGGCAVALAGGVNLTLHPNKYLTLSQGRFMSSNGRCESFGHGGDGYVPGEGVGSILLKPLSRALQDGDRIYATIHGSALNHGGKTNGYTVPNPHAQSAVIRRAIMAAGVDPNDISYIEAHGTGTVLGDPIEVSALAKALGPNRTTPIAIGSVKSNIGHCESAAGIAGLTKILLQLRHGMLVPSLHSETLNPNIDFDAAGLRVQRQLGPWPQLNGKPRIAGLSSFGAGGSNAHLVIEDYLTPDVVASLLIRRVFPFSARDEAALNRVLHAFLTAGVDDLAAAAFVLQEGREAFEHRIAVVATSKAELQAALRNALARKDAHGLYRGERRAGVSIDPADVEDLDSVAAYWVDGAEIDWARLRNGPRRRISLPTYPFAKERHWFAPEPMLSAARLPLLFAPEWHAAAATPDATRPDETLIILCGNVSIDGIDPARVHTLAPRETAAAGRLAAYAVGLSDLLRPLLTAPRKILVQLVVPLMDDPALPESLGGMLRTACHECPQLRGQTIGVDRVAPPLEVILRTERQAGDSDIRYQSAQRLVRRWIEPDLPAVVPRWKDRGVYLITGGTGGLGRLLCAEIARHAHGTVLLLASRTPPDPFDTTDAIIVHHACDVTDAKAVTALVARITQTYGRLDGVVHAAGMIRDRALAKKTADEIRAVLAAKVAGAVNLDAATADLDLDMMLLFGSAAGALGNAGQADYATANAFLDAFASARNARVASGARHGTTLSIDWPYWRDGGMQMPDSVIAAMDRLVGVRPLETRAAMAALDAALSAAMQGGPTQVMVLDGDHARLRSAILPAISQPVAQVFTADDMLDLARQSVAATLQLDPTRIDPDQTFDRYGMDSVTALQLAETLARALGPVPNTLPLEHPTLRKLAAALQSIHTPISAPTHISTLPPAAEVNDIAVIAVAGRYPGADTIEAFWQALREGRDLVTEIPPDRWNNAAIFDADKGRPGRTNCRWGGFLSDVDRFDAALFGVSPRDAARMDPQERLFLETVWRLLESAGHTRARLRTHYAGRVGVYAGAMYQQYQAFATHPDDRALLSLGTHAALANRVSFFFDLQGPSVAVDAMCASGLEAVHLACQGLLRGECKLAIAGAVNLSLHADKYLGLSRSGMLGSHADSRSFSDGDGYLPAEGVGAVLLKPLADALRDRDDIFGIIKASASNHAGHSAGFGVPSLDAQARLIEESLRASAIDPRSITYAEAAATGVKMADAIELRAATQAFRAFTTDSGFCAIGSVKSNMGHAEAASGLAQLTKVLLQLRHRTLVPSVRTERLNPDLTTAGTPFRFQTDLAPWLPGIIDNAPQPLCATVSSFGAGGSNVFMVLQEAPARAVPPPAPDGAHRFTFSAQADAHLGQVIADTAAYVRAHPDLCLGHLAATLEFCRERLACGTDIIANGRNDLLLKLDAWPEQLPPTGTRVLPNDDTLWPPLDLPPTPLARERHWLDDAPADAAPSGNAEALILKVLAEETGHAAPEPDARFRDLGATSMFGLRLIRTCADQLGVTLTNRDIEAHPSARSLAEFLCVGEPVTSPAQERIHPNAPLPLSEGQAGLWALQTLHPSSGAYNVPLAFKAQRLNAEALRRACAALAARFPILACRFPVHDGIPFREPTPAPTLQVVAMPQDADPVLFARGRVRQPFDLTSTPPLRCEWLQAGGHDIVLLVIHHIAIDGLSALLIAQAFWDFYERFATGAALPPPRASSADHADFAAWESDFLASPRGAAQHQHWARLLTPPPVMLILPTDRPAASAPSFEGRHLERVLPADLTQTARRTATQLGINPSVLFLGVLQILLSHLSDTNDVLVGMPTLGRPEQRFEGSIGLFANLIPVRVRIDHQQSMAAFLAALQDQITDGLDNAFYPYAALCRELGPGGQPLHHVGYAYTNAVDLSLADPMQLADGARIAPLPALRQEGDSLFALEISERRDMLRMLAVYDPSRFDEATIGRMLDQFNVLLRATCAHPDAGVGTLDLLDPTEIARIAALGQGNPLPQRSGAVHEWIVETARHRPWAIAVICDGPGSARLRYGGLLRQARLLSAHLRSAGAGPGSRVGVLLTRGPASIITLLAVMGSGAAWVPLDPGSPDARLALVLRDCQCAVLVTDSAHVRRARSLGHAGPLIDINHDAAAIRRHPAHTPFTACDPAKPAYIIYTSGSTGAPKGVVISHAALAAQCDAIIAHYQLRTNDMVLQFAQHDVDTALEQILPTLVRGARLRLRGPAAWSPADLARAFNDGVTVADLSPAYLQAVLQAWINDGRRAPRHTPRLLIAGGEVMPPTLVSLWRNGPLARATLLNAYGPTEATITATTHDVGPDPESSVPIGRPLPGVVIRILDRAGRPVPEGVPGELHIGGRLALGYHQQPELTRSRFVLDPIYGGRLYRTGDRAAFLPGRGGVVAFLGRMDEQVQIRGFRVEPGEVEAVLAACGAPSCAVVAASQADGTMSLVAFVGAPSGFDIDTLGADAAKRLPPAARPARIIRLDDLPISPSGKVDRQALLLLDVAIPDQIRPPVAARDDVEAQLLRIWHAVLGEDLPLGVEDDFFAAGGHSLSAVRLAAQIHQAFGQTLTIAQLLEASTIAAQARLLDNRPAATREIAAGELITRLRPGGTRPLFCLHAAGGTATGYLHLARAMAPDWAVYGVQSPGLTWNAPAPRDLAGLAAAHVAALRRVQPVGPYRLLGWSVGGTIAFEVARQLQAQGQAVQRLILLDAYAPAALRAVSAAHPSMLAAFAYDLAESTGADADSLFADGSIPDRVEALAECSVLRDVLAGIDATRLRQLYATFTGVLGAVQSYDPQRQAVATTLFRVTAEDRAPDMHGWQGLVRGDLRVRPASGRHGTMLAPRHVAALAKDIGQELDRRALSWPVRATRWVRARSVRTVMGSIHTLIGM